MILVSEQKSTLKNCSNLSRRPEDRSRRPEDVKMLRVAVDDVENILGTTNYSSFLYCTNNYFV